MLFTAFNQGYLGILMWPFATMLLGGVGMMVWLALTASPVCLLSLVTAIFAIGYISEPSLSQP